MQRKEDTITQTITGGEQQKNDSHYIELLAACAALDFYNTDENQLQQNKDLHKTDYEYRAVSESGKLDFEDFVGKERAKEFAQKFGMLIAFSLFCNGKDDFVESVRSGGQKEIQEFVEMDITQAKSLREYFNLFFVKKVGDNLQEGWLRQIHRSAGGQDAFLFNANLFSPMTFKELMKMDWNKCIYRNEGIGKDNTYSKSGMLGFGSLFDPFKKQFIQTRDTTKEWQNLTNKGEQLYKLIFDTLAKLYKFN